MIENPKTQNKNESNLNLSNKKNSIKKGKNVSAPVPTTVSTLAIEEKSIGTDGGGSDIHEHYLCIPLNHSVF